MTIENSELNTSGALAASNAGLTGASGTGNDPSLADLAKGYTHLADPPPLVRFMPQAFDDGENMVGDPFDRGGFAGRPMGNQR